MNKEYREEDKNNGDELWKIRLRRNASIKHEVVKTILAIKIKEKYKTNLNFKKCYTEHEISYGWKNHKPEATKITDVYFEDTKAKEIICYEIQDKVTDKWEEETINFYKKYQTECSSVKYFNFKAELVIIPLKELSNDFEEINKQLDKFII